MSTIDLTVEIRESDDATVLPVSAADVIGLDDGGVVRLEYGVGNGIVTTPKLDDSIGKDRVLISSELSGRLGVEGGETVAVETVSPDTASRIRLAPVPRLSIQGGAQLLRDAIGDAPLTDGETVSVSFFDGSLNIPFRVLSTDPSGPVFITTETDVRIEDGPAPVGTSGATTPVPESAVGGYEDTAEKIKKSLVGAFGNEGRTGEIAPRRVGMLLAGPHGVGKTHLLRYAAWATNASIHRVLPQRLLSSSGETAADHLRSVATTARGSGRGVIHLDAFDTVLDEANAATVAAIREWLDRMKTVGEVTVVAEVTDPSAVPVDLRQGTRLSKTVTVPEPGRSDRGAILSTLASNMSVGASVDVAEIGSRAFGYVPGDLVSLWLTAAELAAERTDAEQPAISEADLEEALELTEPSGFDQSTTDIPTTTFDDIGGLDEAKRELIRAVKWPLTNPELFEAIDIEPPGGILLYGPPGTGKTMLARAVSSMSNANFTAINGPEMMNRYVGESERAVRRVFEQARANAPAVLFFDEIDAIGVTRAEDNNSPATDRVVSQLLTELDGVERRGGVTVVGATNRPGRLDDALLRPGRFDRLVSVPMPDAAARAEIFRIHLRERVTGNYDIDVHALAEQTEGYTGSDIAAIVREAGLLAIESRIRERSQGRTAAADPTVRIRERDLKRALETVDPSLSPETRTRYDSLDQFE